MTGNKSDTQGHFFARCDRAWSDQSLTGEPATIENVAEIGERSQPVSRHSSASLNRVESIWRAIRGEIDPAVRQFHTARAAYQDALRIMVEHLHPRELEDLVDLLFARGRWSRLGKVGGTEKDWDLQTEHPELGERAAVQVKVDAGQSELADYEQRYINDGRFTRLFFVVARLGSKELHPKKAEVWTSAQLAELVERRGFAEWSGRAQVIARPFGVTGGHNFCERHSATCFEAKRRAARSSSRSRGANANVNCRRFFRSPCRKPSVASRLTAGDRPGCHDF